MPIPGIDCLVRDGDPYAVWVMTKKIKASGQAPDAGRCAALRDKAGLDCCIANVNDASSGPGIGGAFDGEKETEGGRAGGGAKRCKRGRAGGQDHWPRRIGAECRAGECRSVAAAGRDHAQAGSARRRPPDRRAVRGRGSCFPDHRNARCRLRGNPKWHAAPCPCPVRPEGT